MPSVRSRGLAAFLSIAATGFGIQILTVLSGPLVARMLGPDGRGLMGMLVAVALLCSLLGVGGLPAAIAHAVAAKDAPARDVVRGSLGRWLAWMALPSLLAAGITAWFVRDQAHQVWLSVLGGVLTYLLAANFLLSAMVLGEGNVRKVNIQRVAGMASYVGVVLVLFLVHPTESAGVIVGIYALSLVGGAWMCLAFLKPAANDPTARAEPAEVHAFARKGWVSGLNALDGLGADQLLVGVVLGQVALGFYAVSVSIASFSSLVLGGVAAVLLPRMVAAGAQASVAVMRGWLAIALVLDVLMVVGIVVVVGPAIRIFFGHEFEPAIEVTRVLAVAWGVLAMRRVLTAAAQAQGKVATASVAEATATVLFLVGAIPAMHVWDLEGAGFAMLLAGGVFCVWISCALSWRRPADHPLDEVELTDVVEIDDGEHLHP
ncbi:hypothetical protein GCM10025786_29920 [Nocardioides caeni]